MARILLEGFEDGTFNRWPFRNLASTSGYVTDAEAAGYGIYSLYFTGLGTHTLRKPIIPIIPEVYFQVKFKITSWSFHTPTAIMGFLHNDGYMGPRVCISASRYLEARNGNDTIIGTGSFALDLNIWHTITGYFLMHQSSGAVWIKLNGLEDISATGAQTSNSSSTSDNIGGIELGYFNWGSGPYSCTGNQYYDDIILDNSEEIVGAPSVIGLPVSGADLIYNNCFAPSLSGSTKYDILGTVPTDLNTHCYSLASSASGITEAFVHDRFDEDFVISSLKSVQISSAIKGVGYGVPLSASVFVLGEAASASGNIDLIQIGGATNVGYIEKIFETDGDGNLWDRSRINSMRYGVKIA